MKPRTLILAAFTALILVQPGYSADAKKLLVVTTTAGFRHGAAIDASRKALPEMTAESNGELAFDFVADPGQIPEAGSKPVRAAGSSDADWAKIQADRTAFEEKIKADRQTWLANVKTTLDAKINPTALAAYDGVIFCNTTGDDLPVDVDALTKFVKSGKAFIGIHAATDTLKHNTAYMEMINGGFAGHPWGSGEIHGFTNQDPKNPIVSMFAPSFQWKDEIYQYNYFNPEAVHVLLSLDMANSKPQRPYHVPVAWIRDYGTGRVFYTSLGHNSSSWQDKTYQKHVTTGIRWALKMIDADAKPNPEVSSRQAIKSIAVVAPTVNKDAAAIETKALAKAKADPQWALKLAVEADRYRALPDPDPKKEPAEKVAKADADKHEILLKLIDEIEK
jgi:type 1 glutamine amidotransferase